MSDYILLVFMFLLFYPQSCTNNEVGEKAGKRSLYQTIVIVVNREADKQ